MTKVYFEECLCVFSKHVNTNSMCYTNCNKTAEPQAIADNLDI
jgi:hypothetical protein